MTTTEFLCCPNCNSVLVLDSGFSSCKRCGKEFQIHDEIIDFLPGENNYWGEISKEKMLGIIQKAQRTNWWTAVFEGLSDRKNLINYIIDPNRLGWLFHCYNENATNLCVDIGSGWGSLSHGLSKYYSNIISIEGVIERLKFQQLRARSENVDNITFIRNNSNKIPLLDNVADLVVLNGVLEWIGLNDQSTDPGNLQINFLKEIKRILKPNGTVYIGIENRTGFLYFLGSRDHSGFPFTSLMPRFLANTSTKILNKFKRVFKRSTAHVYSGDEEKYRTYTYTYSGYKKLLTRAGYSNIDIYWAWPGYSYPKMSGSINGAIIKFKLKSIRDLTDKGILRFAFSTLSILPDKVIRILLKHFSQHFLIFANGKPQNSSFQTKNKFQEQQICGTEPNFLRQTMGGNISLKTTYLSFKEKKLDSVHLVKEVKTDENYIFECQNHVIVQGRNIRPYSNKDLIKVAEWLSNYQKESLAGYWKKSDLEKEIISLRDGVFQYSTDLESMKLIERFVELYIKEIQGVATPIVSEHGDFTPPNILIHQQEINPVDWEYFNQVGVPYRDLGSFSLSLLRRENFKYSWRISKKPISHYNAFSTEYLKYFSLPMHISPGYYLLSHLNNVCKTNESSGKIIWFLSKWLPLFPPILKWME